MFCRFEISREGDGTRREEGGGRRRQTCEVVEKNRSRRRKKERTREERRKRADKEEEEEEAEERERTTKGKNTKKIHLSVVTSPLLTGKKTIPYEACDVATQPLARYRAGPPSAAAEDPAYS